jgi:hypothetical protein
LKKRFHQLDKRLAKWKRLLSMHNSRSKQGLAAQRLTRGENMPIDPMNVFNDDMLDVTHKLTEFWMQQEGNEADRRAG